MQLRRFFIVILISIATVGSMAAAGNDTDSPRVGDMVVDAGIGVGLLDAGKSKAMFTQRIGVEWVVLPEFVCDKLSLAAGIYINNAYGNQGKSKLIGTYDYEYTININSQITGISHNKVRRTGYGTASAVIKRDDLNFIPTVSARYQVTPRLEAYFSIGVGIGIMNAIIGDKENVSGFDSKSYSGTDNIGTKRSYSYNDLEHADWGDVSYNKVTAALATYVGVRYTLTSHWGISGQFGLISANIKKSLGNSYNLFSVGASYRF